ncbi:MAG: HPr family phosphocarrier protein [Parvularcula sp.]
MSYSADIVICNVRGLHARASAKFCALADQFDADISVRKDNTTVGGTSLMALLMLGAAKGSTITIRASGHDAEAAVKALVALVSNRFDEDA